MENTDELAPYFAMSYEYCKSLKSLRHVYAISLHQIVFVQVQFEPMIRLFFYGRGTRRSTYDSG